MRVSYVNKTSGILNAWFTEYNTVALNPGDSFDKTLDISMTTLILNADRTKPLVAQMDPANVLQETDENNNELEVALPLPDLWLTSFSIPDNRHIAFSFKNNGSTTFYARQAEMRVSFVNIHSGDLNAWFTQYNTVTMNPGDSFGQTVAIAAGALTPNADRTKPLVVQMDPANVLQETDENNNRLEVTIPIPDLRLRQLSMPDGTHISYSLDNLGTITLPPNTVVMYFDWIDAAGAAHRIFGSANNTAMAPGNAANPTVLTVSSQQIPAQAVKLRVTVDPGNNFQENDETNNMMETSIVR